MVGSCESIMVLTTALEVAISQQSKVADYFHVIAPEESFPPCGAVGIENLHYFPDIPWNTHKPLTKPKNGENFHIYVDKSILDQITK